MRVSRLFKILWLFAGVTILCLTAFRLWLPNFIKNQLTERFERMDLYTVAFRDIDVSFIDASYAIRDIEVHENDSKAPVPLFTADAIRFTLPWSHIVGGNFVCIMNMDSASLNFVRGPSPETSQTGVQTELSRLLKKLSPYPVDEFYVNGEISFRDYHQTPRIEMKVTNVTLHGANLRNTANDETLLPGKISGRGTIGGGSVLLTMKVNPLQDEPIFEMETTLDSIDLHSLAGVLKADHEVHVENGTLTMTATTTSRENVIATKVTRTFSDLQARRWKKPSEPDNSVEDDEKGKKPRFIVMSWTTSEAADTGDQVIEGEIENYKGNLLTLTGETLVGIFTNAVLQPLEDSVSRKPKVSRIKIAKAEKKEKKNLLQKLFKKKEGKKQDSDETATASGRK